MSCKQRCLLALLAVLGSLGATHQTPNFIIEAPNKEIAKKIGDKAEIYRKEIASQWLGEEMPTWGRPCPIKVTVTLNGPSGATAFDFDNGAIRSIRMHVEGRLDSILANVLPHEVTHTVLAYYFRKPLPRWADEGASVLSESEKVRAEYERNAWRILQMSGQALSLRRLLSLMEYPDDVRVLYAQGYSVSRFLIESSNRKTFLAFVAEDMDDDWDVSCKKHYRYKSIEQMEAAWVKWMRAEKRKRERSGKIAAADFALKKMN
jgi:hypothetical protein